MFSFARGVFYPVGTTFSVEYLGDFSVGQKCRTSTLSVIDKVACRPLSIIGATVGTAGACWAAIVEMDEFLELLPIQSNLLGCKTYLGRKWPRESVGEGVDW